jgi:hypothetical protein
MLSWFLRPSVLVLAWLALLPRCDRPNPPLGSAHTTISASPGAVVCAPGTARAVLVAQSHPDETTMRPGKRFRFAWTVLNTGRCAWPAAAAIHAPPSHSRPLSSAGRTRSVGRPVQPGQTHTFLVSMGAPRRAGTYYETWQLWDGTGHPIMLHHGNILGGTIRVLPPGARVLTPPFCEPGRARARLIDPVGGRVDTVRVAEWFTARWTIHNVGTCAWAGAYRLHLGFPRGNGDSRRDERPRDTVPPRGTYTFELRLRAPDKPGLYVAEWRFEGEDGAPILTSESSPAHAWVVPPER